MNDGLVRSSGSILNRTPSTHENDDAGLRQGNKDKLGIVTEACHSYIQSKRPDENIVAKRNMEFSQKVKRIYELQLAEKCNDPDQKVLKLPSS